MWQYPPQDTQALPGRYGPMAKIERQAFDRLCQSGRQMPGPSCGTPPDAPQPPRTSNCHIARTASAAGRRTSTVTRADVDRWAPTGTPSTRLPHACRSQSRGAPVQSSASEVPQAPTGRRPRAGSVSPTTDGNRGSRCASQRDAGDTPPLQVAAWTSWVRVLIFSLNAWICSVRFVFFVSRSVWNCANSSLCFAEAPSRGGSAQTPPACS